MNALSWLVLLSAPGAQAFTLPMQGVYAETMLSGNVVDTARVGGAATAGFWFGQYDDAYALGKFLGLGTHLSVEHSQRGTMLIPQFELRRGWDILLAQISGSLRVGPEFAQTSSTRSPRWRASVGGQVKYRYHRYWGTFLNVHGGVITAADPDGPLGPTLNASLGIAWSAPVSK
jgi:hypothetical protein